MTVFTTRQSLIIALASDVRILYMQSVTGRWLLYLFLGAALVNRTQKISTSAELEKALVSVKPGGEIVS
jgi:hypothetical protein